MSKHTGYVHPVTAYLTDAGGIPQTGKTMKLFIVKFGVGIIYYWDGTTWTLTKTPVSMTEVDPTNLPGIYKYDINTGHANWDVGFTTTIFTVMVYENLGPVLDTYTIDTKLEEDYYIRSILEPKLPTNNIMGSSVKTDKDDEIDAIKVKTDLITGVPALESTAQAIKANTDSIPTVQTGLSDLKGTGFIKDTDSMVNLSHKAGAKGTDSIYDDTNETQGKLPTNNILGSSDKLDHDSSIEVTRALTEEIKKATIGEIATIVSDALNTPVTFKTSLLSSVNDYYIDQIVVVEFPGNIRIARRVSAYNGTTKFVTVSSAFPAIPSTGQMCAIVSIFAAAGSSLTEATIADAVWDEAMASHMTGGTSGAFQNRVPEIETDTQDIQGRLPGTLNAGRMRSHTEAQDNLPLTVQQKLDVNTEVDGALNTPVPGSPVTDSINERVKSLDDNYTPARALKIDFLDQSLVGMEADIRGIDNDTLKTLSDQLDLIYTKVIVLPTDPADQSMVEAAITAAIASIKGTPPVDNQTLYQSISQIQNNVKTAITVPAKLLKPETGSKTYRFTIANYDSIGNMEDFDSNPNCKIDQLDGTPVLPWTATTRDSEGMYHIDVNVLATDPNMVIVVTFEMVESAVTRYRSLPSEVTDIDSQLADIEQKVDDILEDTSITLPTQISAVETSINNNVDAAEVSINTNVDNTRTILQNEINENQTIIERLGDAVTSIVTIPKKILIPTSTSKLNNGGLNVTAVQTEIPIFNIDVFPDTGVVKIENEIIHYASIDRPNSKLTGCTRGFLGTTAAEHVDELKVMQVIIHYFMIKYRDADGNAIVPSTDPVFRLINENGDYVVDSFATLDNEVSAYVYHLVTTPESSFQNLQWYFFSMFAGLPSQAESGEIKSEFIGTTASTSSSGGSGGLLNGEFLFDQDGYTDNDGVVHEWPDEYAGYVRDPSTGDRLQDVAVRAFRVLEDGEVARDAHPPYEWETDLYGNYYGALDRGTYMFEFTRDGHVFFQVEREIDP